MQTNVHSLLDQIDNAFSSKVKLCGIIIITISLIALISNLFVVIVINKFNGSSNSKDKQSRSIYKKATTDSFNFHSEKDKQTIGSEGVIIEV